MSDNGTPIEFYHKNPRQITVQQFENLERWLEELGDLSGVVHDLNSNQIIGGNQRGRVFEINECEIVLTDVNDEPDEQGTVAIGYILWKGYRYGYRQVRWTEHQCEMANIVANKAGGEWDFDILANEFELDDLLNWGFIEHDLDLDLWLPEPPEDPGAQIDRADELRAKWGVETGQLWQLGEHRLIVGDCTDAEVVARVMDGERAQITITDPPYNVGIKYTEETDDNQSFDDYLAWTKQWSSLAPESRILTVGIQRLVWWDTLLGDPQWIIAWVKRNGQGNTKLLGTNKWDAILVYDVEPDGGIDIIELNNDYSENIKEQGLHPTAKPVELYEILTKRFTADTDLIYEPFLGSGTTLIACERLGRKCRAVEISPAYCAVAIQRWVDMTSGEPELLGDPHGIEEPSQYKK